ncbi:MAG: hypothetical protein ACE5FY_08095, partial [Nitrospiria bacterium]
KLYKQFPENDWLESCIIDARENEQAAKVCTLSFEDIKELYKKKSKTHLVNSIHDLHELVCNKLQEYQRNLQGDTPAIEDLWNSKGPISPRDEEYLSGLVTKSVYRIRPFKVKEPWFSG